MRTSRSLLLVVSTLLVLLVLGGGLAVRVGAEETSYRQAVLFAEILSLVMENYVDDVEAERLLAGAYEGLLSGLDANGAFLTPDEVAEWKRTPGENVVGAGMSVLKGGSSLQVVAVAAASSAADAGVTVGDQVREIDGRPVADLSLAQCRRLLEGAPGSTFKVAMLRREDDFKPYDVELSRGAGRQRSWDLTVRGAVALLTVRDVGRISADTLADELDDVRSRGVERLLVDLRNAADGAPPAALPLAALFTGEARLVLKKRSGEIVRSADGKPSTPGWKGDVAVLVNGATAGAAEALALLLQQHAGARIFGETTFGLGAEADLLELGDGSGLLVSVALWETAGGSGWNDDGIEPDEAIRGRGTSYAEIREDQLNQVIERIEAEARPAQAA